MFFTAFWLITSPNPRFGVGYFAIIPACLSIFILNFFHIRSKLNYLDKIKNFFIIYCLVSSYILIKKNFKFNDLFVYPQKKIEAVETTKRNSFGVKTIFKCNIHESNFCWLEKNCYFIEKDANLHYLGFNYMLFKKINDRQHPKCK